MDANATTTITVTGPLWFTEMIREIAAKNFPSTPVTISPKPCGLCEKPMEGDEASKAVHLDCLIEHANS